MSNDHRRGILWALGAALGIATFVIPWKIASGYNETSFNTLILLVSAAVFNTLLATVQQRALPTISRFDLLFASVVAALTLVGNLASARAIVHLSPAVLTVAQRSEVIIVALLAWPLIGERTDRRFWIGACIAGLGLVYMQDPFASGKPLADGMGWAMVSAVSFSGIAVVTRRFIGRFDVVAVNALRLWLSVALWFVFHGFPPRLLEITPAQLGWVSLAALCGPFLGRLCMMTSARYIEARITTLATLVAPVLTLALGFLVLGDLPSAREIQGGAIMLLGISVPLLGLARTGTRNEEQKTCSARIRDVSGPSGSGRTRGASRRGR